MRWSFYSICECFTTSLQSLAYSEKGGLLTLACAIVAFVLIYEEFYEWLWIPICSCVLVIACTVGYFFLDRSRALNMLEQTPIPPQIEPFGSMLKSTSSLVLSTANLGWGIAVLVIGLGLLTCAAIMDERST